MNKNELITLCKEAMKENSNLYILNVDSRIKIMIDKEKMFSEDFLRINNLSYEKNLIQGIEPKTLLKYNQCNDLSIDLILDLVNKACY